MFRFHLRPLNILILLFILIILCIIVISFLSLSTNNIKDQMQMDTNEYFLIILILSAPKNIEHRNAIRDTWANLKTNFINNYDDYNKELIYTPVYSEDNIFLIQESVENQQQLLENFKEWMLEKYKFKKKYYPEIKVKHYFLIGTADLKPNDIKAIDSEHQEFKDVLILTELQDHYKNLTFKVIEGIREIVDTHKFKYLLKCDDDSYVKLDLLVQDLYFYSKNLIHKHMESHEIDLYWGYFNGRARVKTSGPWTESNYHISDNYVPYALGGGYIISMNIAKYITSYHNHLNRFNSEDISMGVWTTPFRNIHRRHDVRFDTEYIPRVCRNYHIVLHKRAPKDMYEIYNNNLCTKSNKQYKTKEYFYDWTKSSSKCCDTLVEL